MAVNTETARLNLFINTIAAEGSVKELTSLTNKMRNEWRLMQQTDPGYAAKTKQVQQLTQATADLNSKTKASSDVFNQLGTSLGFPTTAMGLLAVAIGAVVAIGNKLLTTGAQISDLMADVQKTTGMTSDEVKFLTNQLGNIDTRTSVKGLLEIAGVGGQFGIAKDQILDFTKSLDVLNVALSSEMKGGPEDIARIMGGLRNIFTDIKTQQIDQDILHIGNAINKLSATGAATSPVIADFAGRIGGVGITLGLTTPQVLGLSATLQELNITAERGGTAVQRVLGKMTTNTKEFAKIAGLSVKEYTDALAKPDGLYNMLVRVSEQVTKNSSSSVQLSKTLADLGIDAQGAKEVFAKLGNNTDLLNEKVMQVNDSITKTDSIMGQFNVKNETFGALIEKNGNKWGTLFATITQSSNNFFTSFIQTGNNALDVLTRLVKGTQQLQQEAKADRVAEILKQDITEIETLAKDYQRFLNKTQEDSKDEAIATLRTQIQENIKALEDERKHTAGMRISDVIKRRGEIDEEVALEKKRLLQIQELQNAADKEKKKPGKSTGGGLSDEEIKEQEKAFNTAAKAYDKYLNDLAALDRQYSELKTKLINDDLNRSLKENADKYVKEKAVTEKALNDDLEILENAHKTGVISDEQFEQEKVDINKRFSNIAIAQEEDYVKKSDKIYTDFAAKQQADLQKDTAENLKLLEERNKKALDIQNQLNLAMIDKKINKAHGELEGGDELQLQEEKLTMQRDIELQNTQLTADEKLLIQKKYENGLDVLRNQRAEKERQIAKKIANEAVSFVQQAVNAGFQIEAQNRQTTMDAELSALGRQRDAELANKNLTEDGKAQINAKYDEQERQLKIKNWKAQQEAAILMAVINGALAIIQSLANNVLPYPASLIAPISIAAVTAVNVGVIASQQQPAFQHGTEYVDGNPGIDTTPALLTTGERVLTVDQNSQLGGIPNEELPLAVSVYNDVIRPKIGLVKKARYAAGTEYVSDRPAISSGGLNTPSTDQASISQYIASVQQYMQKIDSWATRLGVDYNAYAARDAQKDLDRRNDVLKLNVKI